MKKAIILVLGMLLLIGCASINKTYQSHGEIYSSTKNIQLALVKGQLNMSNETHSQIAVVGSASLRIGNIENVIAGHLLKNGISIVSPDEFLKLNKNQREKCIIVEWGVSGRNSRGGLGAYSQEVVVIIKNALSGELVYKGIGEYLGQTEIDDLRGALLAALNDFKT